MSSRRAAISRLTRSSSFRLMLVYAVLFTLSVLVLFAIIVVTTDGFMTRQIDGTVAYEIDEVRADAGGIEAGRVRPVIDELVKNSRGFFYLLEDKGGRVMAGNMLPIRRVPGLRSLDWPHRMPRAVHDLPVRGQGVVLPDGSYLFVGVSAAARDEMRHSLLKAFLWSLGVVVVFGLGGGLMMSMLVLRRIEAISLATRSIMSGDLSKRIPVGGSGDEFDHLSGSLNAMLDRIVTLVSGMRQVSNDIAHDLRTPLTRLRQRLELARRRDNTVPALHSQVDNAINEIDGVLATFTALLRTAQIEARAQGEGFTDVALYPLVSTLLEAYGPVADEKGQFIRADVPHDVVIRGDKALLSQLVANLVENAIHHTPTGSHVVVSVERQVGSTVLIVADDGPGIPADKHDHVLRRFGRLDISRNTPGSGLGLSLVKAISDYHGATFVLADNGPGLVCHLAFPHAGISTPRER